MHFPPVLLEDWLRLYYFDNDADLSSSGAENYSLGELREMLGIRSEELDALLFRDSHTLGGAGLRQALADRFLGGATERVMVSHGSTEANFLVQTALLRPGDEVVILDPFYQQLYSIAESIGCQLRRWHLRYERGYRPDFDELAALMGPRTRMVIVNFPHNPTGATLTPDEQAELVRRCAQVGAYLVWDAAFAELAHDAPPLPDPVLSYDRALSMGTLSKAYGLPGLRVGWCFAAPELLEPFITLRDYTLIALSPLTELLAERVIRQGDLLVEPRRQQGLRHRQRVDAWIAEHREHVEWVRPASGVCGFPRFRADLDVDAFCHRLMAEHRVLLVPGSCFRQPRHARLGFGCPEAELERGLAAMSALLRATPPAAPPPGPPA